MDIGNQFEFIFQSLFYTALNTLIWKPDVQCSGMGVKRKTQATKSWQG